MGPSLTNIASIFEDMGSASSVNMEDFVDVKNGVFWSIVNVLLALIAVWVFLFIFIVCKCFNRESSNMFISTLSSYSVLILPILGNMFYLPFISMFTSVFVCYETTGDDKDDAFLAKDCYETCWEGDHMIYLGLAAFSLVVYVPVAVYMRPKWQEL